MIAFPTPPRRGRILTAALVLLGACTATSSDDRRASPAAALESFISAWARADAREMSERFAANSPWTPTRIRALLDEMERDGAITGMEIDWHPADLTRDDDRTEIAYSLTYRSDAAVQPVVLDGELPVAYSESADRWEILWERSLMWPGIDGADGFAIETRYPRRARIMDRDGRVLAAGPATARRYPFGSVAGTTVGHLEPLAKKDIEDGDAREPGDLVGGSGLEAAFEERLAGRPATKLQLVNRRGRVLETVGRRPAGPARSVRTTIDIEVQQAATAAYGATTGGAVVLDPGTGDILAAVASSPFDPSNYVGVAGIEPFNRALSGLYPPGSSMKVMTAAAALETGTVTPSTQLSGPAEYKGVRNFESGEFGTLSFASALQNSVNTAFAQVAEKLGARRLTRFAELFGFNREPEMPLGAARSSFPLPEDEGDLLWSSIGQAQTLATPLQMATLAATIANDGRRMEPRISFGTRPTGDRVVSKKTAATMTTLMESVVQGGTGVGAAISGVRVAGKTGTAEVDVGGERRNHAWFISFAPAGDPKVAVAVVSEYGGVGGQVAAPLARAILTAVLPLVR